MNLKQYRTDRTKEAQGVWVNFQDGKIKLRPLNNADYLRKYRELTKGYRFGDEIPAEQLEPIIAQCLAEAVLIDWKGFTEDDKELPYSKEKATEYLGFFEFRAEIMEEARKLSNFREDATKN